jgi:uncharacterized protein YdhG (YjbR/CyaY superfamily)
MKESDSLPVGIDEYIAPFPPKVRKILEKLRKTVHAAAPGATERISYRMPAFDRKGILVYFAAYERHIGFYPTGEGIAAFRKEIAGYKSSKGAIQFPLDEEIPYELVTRIVEHRVARNEEAAALKTAKKPASAAKKASPKTDGGRG